MKNSEYLSLKAIINNLFMTKIIVLTIIISIISTIFVAAVLYMLIFRGVIPGVDWLLFFDIQMISGVILLLLGSNLLLGTLGDKRILLQTLDAAKRDGISYEEASEKIYVAYHNIVTDTEEILIKS